MQGIKTQVAIERKGKTYSQIIDTSGRVFLELEFDELESFDEKDTTFYKASKGGLWGIVTPKGASLTPFQFDEIYRLGGDSFYASQGENRTLINSKFKLLDLGKWYNVHQSNQPIKLTYSFEIQTPISEFQKIKPKNDNYNTALLAASPVVNETAHKV